MKLLIDLQGAQSESRFRGIGRSSRSISKAIIARSGGHDISILLNGALQQNAEALRAEFAPLLPPEHILTFQIPAPVAEQFPKNSWRNQAADLIREAFIAHHQPDIVFVTSVFEGFLDDAVTAIKPLSAPHATAATLHDLIPLINPDRYLIDEGYRRHYLRRVQSLKRADLLLAVSASARNEALEHLNVAPEIVSVMGSGVEEQFRQLHLAPAQTESLLMRYNLPRSFILCVGAADPRKNVSLLMEAFALLPADMRAAHCLAFAGPLPEEERRRLLTIGARFGIQGSELVFCSHVPDSDLVQLFNTCALFVFPSRHEGFGLPVLEAMACGAPMLAADSTSLPEIVDRADLLFDPDDAPGLAHRMQAVLGDHGFRQTLRGWGLQRASQFTWDGCAGRVMEAFDALHERRNTQPGAKPAALARRKTMAFLSPLPSDRSGISGYSARLLPELARYYDIECIIDDTHVTDPWILANYTLRDVAWFRRNASSYDRILYSVGNSSFHGHMLELVSQYPGVVILHDFFLSDLLDYLCNTGSLPPEEFLRELYLTHGLTGMLAERQFGRLEALKRFACNDVVFRNATGVIVHSNYVVDRACDLYGGNVAGMMAVVPFLQVGTANLDRAEARTRLGIGPNEFLVCSFGLITARKLSQEIFDAWLGSSLDHRDDAVLVFVGDSSGGPYGDALAATIAAHLGRSRIMMTGYASPELYRDYLAAADLAVQLRAESRGETSAAVLDCLAAGLAVVVNAHGPAIEWPDDVVSKLPDQFEPAELSARLEHFHADRNAALGLGCRGREYVIQHHHPARIGQAFHAEIERFEQDSSGAQQQTLLSVLGDFHSTELPTDSDITEVAVSLSRNGSQPRLRQILYDVTVLAEQDARTGIQRVVRSILTTLVQSPPPGYRIEPVRIEGNGYCYARRFAARVLGVRSAVLPDRLVDYDRGDLFLGMDWVPDRLPQIGPWLRLFRDAGGKVVFSVYDLLPLQLPQYFPDFMLGTTQRWFETALSAADQFVCISRTVADDVARFAVALGGTRKRAVSIDYFHIGNDLAASLPSRGLPAAANGILAEIQARKTFLMVGTIEPRKGHRQVLQAFSRLWEQDVDVGLVIVGKRGWMVDSIEELIRNNRENGRRLFWLQGISDEMLEILYARASALVAASVGEGFGLPLIEAARHKLPVIARNIPVFREVAGDHAFYFQGATPDDLSHAIIEWLRLDQAGKAPQSDTMPHQSWSKSADELCAVLFGQQSYKRIAFE